MKPKNNNFRYFIEWIWAGNNNGSREIFPINTNSLKVKSLQESGQIFFRKKLTGTPVLTNNESLTDYSFIKSIEQGIFINKEAVLQFTIKRKNGNSWNTFWNGTFTIFNCDFDDDRCTVHIKDITTLDKYTCLLSNTQKEHNLYDISNYTTCLSRSTQYIVETETLQPVVVGVQGIFATCFTPSYVTGTHEVITKIGQNTYGVNNWALIKQKYVVASQPMMTFQLTSTWARLVTYTLNVAGQPVLPTSGSWDAGTATTYYGYPAHKWVNTDFQAQVYDTAPTVSYQGGCNLFTLDWSSENLLSQTYVYTKNRYFLDLLKKITDECSLNITSNFFNDSVNPVTHQNSLVNYLLIAGKSDIKNPFNEEPQTVAMYTFENIQQWLKNMFQVYWDIDNNGNIKLEHFSTFNKTLGRNLVSLEGGKYIKATKKYSYRSLLYYSKERWEFMESGSIDFRGKDIRYDNLYPSLIKEDIVEQYKIDLLTTDMGFIESQPQEIANEGFVMMACFINLNGVYEVINEIGKASTQNIENGTLSIANLQDRYFRHNRLMPTGYLNDVLTTFESHKKVIQQIELTFPLCAGDALDESKLIRTTMGDGEIISAEFDIKSEMQKVSLIY